MCCEDIADDLDAQELWPLTVAAFSALASWMDGAEHRMDWHLSGDTHEEPGSDREMFDALLVAVLKRAPDDLFPRGKWATIQAIQGRSEVATEIERQKARRRSSEHIERMMEAGWPSLGLPTAECPW